MLEKTLCFIWVNVDFGSAITSNDVLTLKVTTNCRRNLNEVNQKLRNFFYRFYRLNLQSWSLIFFKNNSARFPFSFPEKFICSQCYLLVPRKKLVFTSPFPEKIHPRCRKKEKLINIYRSTKSKDIVDEFFNFFLFSRIFLFHS